MLNEKAVLLLEQVIKDKYQNVSLDSKYYDENEFYYEFKIERKISEKDFEMLERKIKELDPNCHVKLLRISGVYLNGDSNNEMIDRISGKAFDSMESLNEYLKLIEGAKERDHRKIGQDLDLFCFSEYVGKGLPLYTPRGTIINNLT